MGDDRRNDIWGARGAGCDAWLWGSDVHSFKEVYSFMPTSLVFLVTSWYCDVDDVLFTMFPRTSRRR